MNNKMIPIAIILFFIGFWMCIGLTATLFHVLQENKVLEKEVEERGKAISRLQRQVKLDNGQVVSEVSEDKPKMYGLPPTEKSTHGEANDK